MVVVKMGQKNKIIMELIEFVEYIEKLTNKEGYGGDSEFPWGAYNKVTVIKEKVRETAKKIESSGIKEKIEEEEEERRKNE